MFSSAFVSVLSVTGTPGVPVCTREQLAAYSAYNASDKSVAPGCTTLLGFDSCPDTCRAAYKNAVEHAPNCTDASAVSGGLSLHLLADAVLLSCQISRRSLTSQYIPQIVPQAPTCDAKQSADALAVELGTDESYLLDKPYSDCAFWADVNCTDRCLGIIENKIANATVCTPAHDVYTLGEREKYRLVECLTARKEDLSRNTVLRTVRMVDGKSEIVTTAPKPTPSAASSRALPPPTAITVAALMVAGMFQF
jgi:hypothetical protein